MLLISTLKFCLVFYTVSADIEFFLFKSFLISATLVLETKNPDLSVVFQTIKVILTINVKIVRI